MKAFHGKKAIKAKYLSRVRAHAAADKIVKGIYWEGGRGCAVGCTIHGWDHRKYETELGIPRWLALLEDRIFEGMPLDQAKRWPERFLSAIAVGQDLKGIKKPFLQFVVAEARSSAAAKAEAAAAAAASEAAEAAARALARAEAEAEADTEANAANAVEALAEAAVWPSLTEAARAEAARAAVWSRFADKLVELIESQQ
jgi:hypothetical protein